jgi:hypothetical protein
MIRCGVVRDGVSLIWAFGPHGGKVWRAFSLCVGTLFVCASRDRVCYGECGVMAILLC